MPLAFRSQDIALLKEIADFSRGRKITLYLVGGYIRDIILNRQKENPDIDFCLSKNAIKFGSLLAAKIKAGFVVLDKERGCCRLVKKLNGKIYTIDFADFRAATLEGDLKHRDFTINSLALNLEEFLSSKKSLPDLIIDPCCGLKDLEKKIIRVAGKKAFDEDPLRILRAFSLSCIFGFSIDKETLRLIKAKKDKLADVSWERIRDELFKIFDRDNSYGYLEELDKLRILTIIIPEIEVMRGVAQGPYHHLNVFKHSLESVRQLEIVIGEYKNNPEVAGYLNEVISADRKRQALLKLGALLHDIGKPKAKRRKKGKMIFHGHERVGAEITKIIAKRLKLSNEELDALKKMVFLHLRPGYMGDTQNPTPRTKFRYFRDAAQEAVSVLLLSLADQRSTCGRLTTKKSRLLHEKVVSALIREYFRKLKEKKVSRLINGDNLIKIFHLKPSPLIGKILSSLEEAQATGKVKTRSQAIEFAKKIIK